MLIRNFVKEKFLPDDIESDDEFCYISHSVLYNYKQCIQL